jgi:hypothetical protein
MHASVDLLLRLLDQDDGPPRVALEDFEGACGPAVRLWQRMGFVSQEPGGSPIPGCPYCGEGVPYSTGSRLVCPLCHSGIDPLHLLLWPLSPEAFVRWLAAELYLRGGVHQIDETLWQLGTWMSGGLPRECFYIRHGHLSGAGERRLAAFRNAAVLYSLTPPPAALASRLSVVSLLELLSNGDTLGVSGLDRVLRSQGKVRFDSHSGGLWAGDTLLGEVPVGSKEFWLLATLAQQLDHFVPYADLKRVVLERAVSSDATEEATFCQKLKSRIKKAIPKIDLLIVTTNKGDGYRLRAHAELPEEAWENR